MFSLGSSFLLSALVFGGHAAAQASSGTFSVLSYNVGEEFHAEKIYVTETDGALAGLPGAFS
jgi:hypothetical protein